MQRLICASVGVAIGVIVGWISYGVQVRRLHGTIASIDPAERSAQLAQGLAHASWWSLGSGSAAALIGAVVCWRALARRARARGAVTS